MGRLSAFTLAFALLAPPAFGCINDRELPSHPTTARFGAMPGWHRHGKAEPPLFLRLSRWLF